MTESSGRDPLVVWNGLLLDGHNRFDICTKRGIKYRTVEQECADRDAAKVWIIQNQFGRRNITATQRAMLAVENERLVASISGAAKDRQRTANTKAQRQVRAELGEQVRPRRDGHVDAQLGKLAGVSDNYIRKARTLAAKAPAPVKAALRAGTTTINAEDATELSKQNRLEAHERPFCCEAVERGS